MKKVSSGAVVAFSDFSSLFSRQFLIGFLAAPLAGLFLLSQLVSDNWLPSAYRAASASTQVIIIGAVALFVALLLSGLQYPLTRLLEGYPLERGQRAPVLRRVYVWRLRHWQEVFDRLTAALDGPAGPERTRAAVRLNRCFPAKRESLLPTEFGNVLRAFETHPRRRYGLDGIAIWPRVAMLLSESERADVNEASTDVQFFVNLLVVTVLVGGVLAADAASHATSVSEAVLRALLVTGGTLAAGAMCWRASIGAGRRWGSSVRAAFDLHRLELYERLGTKTPRTVAEDQVIGRAINRLFLFAEPIPDNCRAAPTNDEEDLREQRRDEPPTRR